MAIKLNELDGGEILEIAVSGKLTDEEYQRFIPEFEHLAAEHRKISMLFEMSDFHGWEVKAAWDDLKLGVKHHRDIERIAMVGEKKWQRWMAKFSKPFVAAEVCYFDKTDRDDAIAWLEETVGDVPKTAASSRSGIA